MIKYLHKVVDGVLGRPPAKVSELIERAIEELRSLREENKALRARTRELEIALTSAADDLENTVDENCVAAFAAAYRNIARGHRT